MGIDLIQHDLNDTQDQKFESDTIFSQSQDIIHSAESAFEEIERFNSDMKTLAANSFQL